MRLVVSISTSETVVRVQGRGTNGNAIKVSYEVVGCMIPYMNK